MPSIRETILQALYALLQTQLAPVHRGEALPERVPARRSARMVETQDIPTYVVWRFRRNSRGP